MSHPAPPDTAHADTEPKRSPLQDRHVALGAAFTDFGGWQMPVRYASDLAEHHAVRQAAGLFDISHMAEFLVTGEPSGAFLDYALSGSVKLQDFFYVMRIMHGASPEGMAATLK